MKTLTVKNLEDLLGIPGIYTIKINGRSYIGSSTSIGHRLKHHLWALSNQKHHNRTMQNLFNKYGVENVWFYKVEDCQPDSLIEREKYYIDLLTPYMNHILDPQKIVRDDVYKQRLSDGLKSAYAKGLRPHNDKPVYQYTITGEYLHTYSTCSDAAALFNKKRDPSAICMCARGDNYTAYNYRWSYEKVDKLVDFEKKYEYKLIQQLTLEKVLIKTWRSAKDAETLLGITNISRAATKNRTAGGFRWKYV